EGGPIALVRDGDPITINSEAGAIDLNVPASELNARRAAWKKPAYKATRGTLFKYIRLVKNASAGCVTDE
ncbi:MAG TPA: dihydroxy-acid dehydratase, partial [Tepidisphaeraceae bacterium]|nr:dihydroxy-acid dehydratase [Tepidisphaeraceae bacterium]